MRRFIPCRSNGKDSDVLVQTIPDKIEVLGHATMTFTPEQATALAVALNAAATETKRLTSITPLIEQLTTQTEIPEATIVAWDQAQAGNRTGTHPLAGEIK